MRKYHALTFGLTLVLLANSFALFLLATGIDRQWLYLPWGLFLLAAGLRWARRGCQMNWREMGLSRKWRASAMVGALVGLAACVPLALFFLFPFVLSGPVSYRSVDELSLLGLGFRLAVEIPVAIALTEEILFRGILQALFKRTLNLIPALVMTNVIFALWHIVVAAQSMQQNTVTLPLPISGAAPAIGYIASLVAVGLGGLILSALREWTNHLAAGIVVHWLVDAIMTLLIYFA